MKWLSEKTLLRYIPDAALNQANDQEISKKIFHRADGIGDQRVYRHLAGAGADIRCQPIMVLAIRAGLAETVCHKRAMDQFHRGTAGIGSSVVWRGTFHFTAGESAFRHRATFCQGRIERPDRIGACGRRIRPARGSFRRHGRGASTAHQ